MPNSDAKTTFRNGVEVCERVYKDPHTGETIREIEDVSLRKSAGRLAPPADPSFGLGQPDQGEAFSSASILSVPEYRKAHSRWLKTGDAGELRSMNITADPSGGYLVPDGFFRAFVLSMDSYTPYRQIATVLPTTSSTSIPIPSQDGEAYWIGEGEDYQDSDETIGLKVLGSHKLTRLIKVSEELVQDSFFSIDEFLAMLFARAFAKKEEPAFTTGNGVGQPTGWLVDAEVGKTAEAADLIDPDEIIDLFYSLDSGYRAVANWMMNDRTAAVVRKLKTSTGDYLWNQSFIPGQPDTLLGRPIVPCNSMPDLAADTKPIGFGDFSFYFIADRGMPIVQRLLELYAATGHIGFRMARRMDGILTVPEAIKVLQMGSEEGS